MSNEKHETIADIVAWIRRHASVYGYDLADRIEAAVEFTLAVETAKAAGEGFAAGEQSAKERSCKLGNAAAMREALEALVGVIDECDSGNPLWWHIGAKGVKPLKDARAALSAPPRNCDVGTEKEQDDRLKAFCAKHFRCAADDNPCAKCPNYKDGDTSLSCVYRFLQLPYKEGGAK
jgi:hypothetical protein